MFKTRFISGAVLTLLTIGILYLGGYVTGVAVMLLSLGGVFELMRVYKQEKSAMAVLAYLMTIAYYCFLFFHLEKYLLPLMILYVLLVLAVYVITYPKYTDKDAMVAILAFFRLRAGPLCDRPRNQRARAGAPCCPPSACQPRRRA